MMELIRRPSSLVDADILNEFDRFFDDFWTPFRLSATRPSLPVVDIYSDDDKSMVVEVQAPGFNRDNIEINVRDGALEISGEQTQKEEHRDKRRNYSVRESSTSFTRRIVLPEGSDTENISAELDNGVLRVTIPVDRPEAKRIKIAAPKTRVSAKKLTDKITVNPKK